MKDRSAQEKAAAEASMAIAKTSKRGGRRAGAGRKPNYLRKSGLPPVLAHTILAQHDVLKLWGDLLNSKSDDVRLRCLCYLTDREQGKATQPTELTGALLVQQGDVAERIRQLEKELGYSAPAGNLSLVQPVNSPAEPLPSKVFPPPPPLLPTLECTKHGSYVKAIDGKSDACPNCVYEAQEAERKLLNMLPGGWA